MQTDVLSSHLSQTGFMVPAKTRLKQITYCGNAGQAGNLSIFDTTTAAVSAVYQRSGTTVTVTKTAHGLATGAIVGIGFASASAVSATDGNYTITVTGVDTFTITDPNTGTVAGGTACYYVSGNGSRWMTSFNTLTGATSSQQIPIPGEGMLARNGVYAVLTSITFVTVFYG